MSLLRDIGRLYLLGGLGGILVVSLAWTALLDYMGIANSVPMWRRAFLPRSAEVEGIWVRVPLAYAIIPQPRGVRVVYRFPPFTQAQATFFVQVQRYEDTTGHAARSKTLARCDTLPTSCTTWFADAPVNHLSCTEAHLGTPDEDDPGRFGFCAPPARTVRGVYGCDGSMCAAARSILAEYFGGTRSPALQGDG